MKHLTVIRTFALLCLTLCPQCFSAAHHEGRRQVKAAKKGKAAKAAKAGGKKKKGTKTNPSSNILSEILKRIIVHEGPFGEDWMYVEMSRDGITAQYPVMTAKGAILWGYVGQTEPAIPRAVSEDEYDKLLQATLLTVKMLSTRKGLKKAEQMYVQMSQDLREDYEKEVGIEYPGTLWDYFDAKTDSDINLIPYFALHKENENLRHRRAAPAQTTTEDGSCYISPMPPDNCLTGEEQDPFACLEWETTDPIVPTNSDAPQECGDIGFLEDGVEEDCDLLGYFPEEKYQEFVSGTGAKCCRQVTTETEYRISCDEQGWECNYESDSCNGIWSYIDIYDPGQYAYLHCCTCQSWDEYFAPDDIPPGRNLGFCGDVKDWLINVVTNLADVKLQGAVGWLSTASDVADIAGPRPVWGIMYIQNLSSCHRRIEEFIKETYRDSACTEAYNADATGAMACHHDKKCLSNGHPLCNGDGGKPAGFYVKNDEDECAYVSWDDYGEFREWCCHLHNRL